MKTFNNIFKYTIATIGGLLILIVCLAAAMGYFFNDKLVEFVKNIDQSTNIGLLASNINKQINSVHELINGTPTSSQKSLLKLIDESLNLINEMQNLISNNGSLPIEKLNAINEKLETIKVSIVKLHDYIDKGGNVDTFIKDSQQSVNNLLDIAKEFKQQYFTSSFLSFVETKSKNVFMYIFIGTIVFLSLSILFGIFTPIISKMKNAPKQSQQI